MVELFFIPLFTFTNYLPFGISISFYKWFVVLLFRSALNSFQTLKFMLIPLNTLRCYNKIHWPNWSSLSLARMWGNFANVQSIYINKMVILKLQVTTQIRILSHTSSTFIFDLQKIHFKISCALGGEQRKNFTSDFDSFKLSSHYFSTIVLLAVQSRKSVSKRLSTDLKWSIHELAVDVWPTWSWFSWFFFFRICCDSHSLNWLKTNLDPQMVWIVKKISQIIACNIDHLMSLKMNKNQIEIFPKLTLIDAQCCLFLFH